MMYKSVPEIMELAGIPMSEIINSVHSDMEMEMCEWFQERFYFSRPNLYQVDIRKMCIENRNKIKK
jgi:hypothetical protein